MTTIILNDNIKCLELRMTTITVKCLKLRMTTIILNL